MTSTTLGQQLSVHPKVQLDNVRRWNTRRRWGFTEADFEALGKPPPRPSREMGVVVLVPFLDTVKATFDSLSSVISSQHDRDAFIRTPTHTKSDPRYLRLLPGIEHQRGLRWARLDLGAAPNFDPIWIRHPAWSPHAEVLAAAAHFPEWVRRMNGREVPYVFITGYEHRYGHGAWAWTMSLSRISLAVSPPELTTHGGWDPLWLSHDYIGHGDHRFASPEIVGRNSTWEQELGYKRFTQKLGLS